MKKDKPVEALLAEAVKDNILPITGKCNLSCVFCSHPQNPPEVKVYNLPHLPFEYLQGLISTLDSARKIIIGESVTRLREGEPFTHPEIVKILTYIRQRFPSTLIQVTTNGTLLTQDIIRALADLQPLELIISLNSGDKVVRKKIMNDSKPNNVVEAISLLRGHKIPFHGSVVAMPHLSGWDDLRRTLLFLQEWGALSIRIFIPGFTRFSSPEIVFPSSMISRVRAFSNQMQDELFCPLLLEPPNVEDLNPVLEGVIRGTPAFRAGFRRGDIIVSVNGLEPRCRVEAFNELTKLNNPTVQFTRKGNQVTKIIEKKKGESSGVTMLYDFDPHSLKPLQGHLKEGRNVLLMTSEAAYQVWKQASIKFALPPFNLTAVPSQFFGGTICCAGLLTVRDFSIELAKYDRKTLPEVILLPPVTFDSYGIDLLNQTYGDFIKM